MSMTLEEAIALLNEQYETCKRIYDCSADQRKSYPNVPQFMEALGMALTALRHQIWEDQLWHNAKTDPPKTPGLYYGKKDDTNSMYACQYTGWIEVGRIRIVTTSNSTQSIVFLVLGNQNTKNGILSLLIRIEPKATISATLSNLEWLSVSDEDLVNKFALASEDGYAVLYAKVTSTWDFFHVGILGQAFDTNEFMDPSDSRLFKLTSNWNLEGNHKGTINPILTSSIGFTPEIMGAVAASGWVNGRLFVGGRTGGVTQLGFPSASNSILRQSTSGDPYWTTPANFVKETAVISGTDYTTVRLRGSGLRNADTNPTANGTINWTYE